MGESNIKINDVRFNLYVTTQTNGRRTSTTTSEENMVVDACKWKSAGVHKNLKHRHYKKLIWRRANTKRRNHSENWKDSPRPRIGGVMFSLGDQPRSDSRDEIDTNTRAISIRRRAVLIKRSTKLMEKEWNIGDKQDLIGYQLWAIHQRYNWTDMDGMD